MSQDARFRRRLLRAVQRDGEALRPAARRERQMQFPVHAIDLPLELLDVGAPRAMIEL